MEEQFPAGIEVLAPGPELGVLLAVWLPRQRDLPSSQSIAGPGGRAAVSSLRRAAPVQHARRLLPAARRRSAAVRRQAVPLRDRRARSAPGWSEATARYQAGKAHDIVVRLPVLGETMGKGGMSEDVARAYANSTADFEDELSREVVDAVMADPQTIPGRPSKRSRCGPRSPSIPA